MLCLICGSQIDANSSRKKYCSESCLLEARKQKSKAYRENAIRLMVSII